MGRRRPVARSQFQSVQEFKRSLFRPMPLASSAQAGGMSLRSSDGRQLPVALHAAHPPDGDSAPEANFALPDHPPPAAIAGPSRTPGMWSRCDADEEEGSSGRAARVASAINTRVTLDEQRRQREQLSRLQRPRHRPFDFVVPQDRPGAEPVLRMGRRRSARDSLPFSKSANASMQCSSSREVAVGNEAAPLPRYWQSLRRLARTEFQSLAMDGSAAFLRFRRLERARAGIVGCVRALAAADRHMAHDIAHTLPALRQATDQNLHRLSRLTGGNHRCAAFHRLCSVPTSATLPQSNNESGGWTNVLPAPIAATASRHGRDRARTSPFSGHHPRSAICVGGGDGADRKRHVQERRLLSPFHGEEERTFLTGRQPSPSRSSAPQLCSRDKARDRRRSGEWLPLADDDPSFDDGDGSSNNSEDDSGEPMDILVVWPDESL